MFCVQRRVPTVRTVQQSVEFLQVQFLCCALRLTSVVSASVRHLTLPLARSTPSTSCVCHPSVVALSLRPQCAVAVFASLCRVVVEVSTPDGAYDSAWYSVRPRTGKYFVNYFQYQEFVECICMLNYWFSSNDEICADNYIFSLFMLKDMCRSEKWRVVICTVT